MPFANGVTRIYIAITDENEAWLRDQASGPRSIGKVVDNILTDYRLRKMPPETLMSCLTKVINETASRGEA